MIVARAFALAAVIGLAACIAGPRGNARVPQPNKAVELNRYLGRWYELGRYEASFERGCEGVTADYAQRPDGQISVLNTCRQGGVDGRARAAKGRAKIVAGSNGAKLKVSFFGPFFGDYWVLDHADDYSWSIVGEPSGRYLWILSRDPAPGEAAYAELVGRARAMGYDVTMIRRTRQPPVGP